jgi:hypothetical protein
MTHKDWPTKVDEWSRERPFLLAVIVILLIVIPGFFSFQSTLNTAEKAIDRAESAAVEAKQVAMANEQTVDCVISWVRRNTDALQDRDVVNHTFAAAALDLWNAFYVLIEKPPANGRQVTLEKIDQYRVILRRLMKAEKINPYPEIKKCLNQPIPEPSLFETVAALHPGHPCWGKQVTIRGTYSDDILRGTDGSDVMIGLKGNDLIFGGGGNDRICADRGADTVNGGAGRDRARGGRGDDVCIQSEKTKGC